MNEIAARLVLDDGSEVEGLAFGYPKAVSGEAVFNEFQFPVVCYGVTL